jgi:hypothetical protein
MPRAHPLVSLDCHQYVPENHNPGTKGASGRCSWTDDCAKRPTSSTTVEYETTGRRLTYALCATHHSRVHEYFGVRCD